MQEHPVYDPGTPDGNNPTQRTPISPDGRPLPGERYRIPPRQGRAVRVAAGQTVSVINTHGTQVCDFWAFAAADPGEYLSMAHLHTHLSRTTVRVGDALVSNRRRPLLTMLEDTSPGVHDTLIAACDHYRYRQLGVSGYHDNCTDNLRMALLAIGERASVIPPPLNLWMNTPADANGDIAWLPTVARPGDRVVLRAHVDCIVVMSACPQDITPINGEGMQPTELHVQVDDHG